MSRCQIFLLMNLSRRKCLAKYRVDYDECLFECSITFFGLFKVFSFFFFHTRDRKLLEFPFKCGCTF